MMQGRFNSVGYVGVMPDGTVQWFCCDSDYWEAYEDALDDSNTS